MILYVPAVAAMTRVPAMMWYVPSLIIYFFLFDQSVRGACLSFGERASASKTNATVIFISNQEAPINQAN